MSDGTTTPSVNGSNGGIDLTKLEQIQQKGIDSTIALAENQITFSMSMNVAKASRTSAQAPLGSG
jgi:hypothetical protein